MAACWSPSAPVSGTPATASKAVTSPYPSGSELGRICGNIAAGTPKRRISSSSQARVLRSISMVRLALVTSVMWRPPSGPPVRCQMSHESVVPNRASPASALARSPGTCSSSQASFPAEKYVAMGSPVRSLTSAS